MTLEQEAEVISQGVLQPHCDICRWLAQGSKQQSKYANLTGCEAGGSGEVCGP